MRGSVSCRQSHRRYRTTYCWPACKKSAEVDRLQGAKRRALQLADEWAKEAVELRRRIAELEGRSGGGPENADADP
jgi:hypothetical protein